MISVLARFEFLNQLVHISIILGAIVKFFSEFNSKILAIDLKIMNTETLADGVISAAKRLKKT